jgi:hypothetical protein
MSRKQSLLFLLTLFLLSSYSQAQNPNWSGVIASSRAVNWANAGVPGGVPTNRTQCGSTIAAYNGSPATINNAISSCGSGQYVLLGAGTFNLSGQINFGATSNVTLRGAGADQTFLIFSSANYSCDGLNAVICVASPSNSFPGGPNQAATWSAGYAAGSTSITLSNVSGLTPNKSLIVLDQCDDGFSGATCGTGSASDPGTIFTCEIQGTCATAAEGGAGRNNRAQQQMVLVTAISGNNVTISPGLYMPNWKSGQNPGAFWANQNLIMDGVENLSTDSGKTGCVAGQGSCGIMIDSCYACWVVGTRTINTSRNHVWLFEAAHTTIANNYMFGTLNATDESYGVESYIGSDNLIVNNIADQVVSPELEGGADEGNVYAYNFATNDYFTSSGWFMPGNWMHAAGTAMALWEGNEAFGLIADNRHGTHNLITAFRNYYSGNQPSCFGAPCGGQTTPFNLTGFSRYFNVVGNVLGTPGYANTYADLCCSGSNPTTAVYTVGWAGDDGGADSSYGPNDPYSATSLMRWGNYDTVSGAVQWNSGEVPSGLTDGFANPVPGSHTLPASFYLNAQPSFWNDGIGHSSIPWPPIGPDVSGGDISNSNGHANHIPAEVCYVNASVDSNYQNSYRVLSANWSSGTETLTFVGGTFGSSLLPQGEIRISGASPSTLNGTYQITGSTPATVQFALASNPGSFNSGAMLFPNVRLFNASNCYSGSGSSGNPPPAAPSNLTAIVH